MPTCSVVLSATPLAGRAPDVVRALRDQGWQVLVAATPAALDWADAAELKDLTGYPPRVAFRDPEQPRGQAPVDAVVVVPGTFNTLNKIAAGLADGYATYTACAGLGAGAPVVVVPMVTSQLWGHPARATTLRFLAEAGAELVDPATGRSGLDAISPVSFAAATDVIAGFDPAWITSALALPA